MHADLAKVCSMTFTRTFSFVLLFCQLAFVINLCRVKVMVT